MAKPAYWNFWWWFHCNIGIVAIYREVKITGNFMNNILCTHIKSNWSNGNYYWIHTQGNLGPGNQANGSTSKIFLWSISHSFVQQNICQMNIISLNLNELVCKQDILMIHVAFICTPKHSSDEYSKFKSEWIGLQARCSYHPYCIRLYNKTFVRWIL